MEVPRLLLPSTRGRSLVPEVVTAPRRLPARRELEPDRRPNHHLPATLYGTTLPPVAGALVDVYA
ncbi:MAG: hypothetical protein KIT14_20540 [bacterium]|nr:hypothetical protein [bacterium]